MLVGWRAPVFLSAANLAEVLNDTAILFILVLGQMLVITLGPGNTDLSIPATMTLAATLSLKLMAGAGGIWIAAGLVAGLFGWFVVRLSGIYLAMLTLAFAQITWAIAFQWVGVTGGDNGLLGLWLQGWARGRFEIHFPRRFTLWLKLLRAAVSGDRAQCEHWSVQIGYLTGHESEVRIPPANDRPCARLM